MKVINFDKKPENVGDYIDFYFRKMVKFSPEKNIYSQGFKDFYISIMKDETRRVLEGSGKLRERPWSNFIFLFIEKKEYIKLFGTNSRRRFIYESEISSEGFTLSDWNTSYSGKDPSIIHINRDNNYKITKSIFDRIKNNFPALFIRSYVYITLIIYEEGEEISFDNFYPYYFNTNYKFTNTNGKSGFITNVKHSYLVEDIDFELDLIRNNNRDVIECVKAFTGDIDYIDQTKHHLDNIVEDIENNDKYILVEGAARTGKTIIAMSILNRFDKSQLLLMNYYFYNALKDGFATMDLRFPDDRIFHQSAGKIGYYDSPFSNINLDFLIIDECQRLGERFGLLSRILSNDKHQHTIFFGDDYQKLNPRSDDGTTYVIDSILNLDYSIKNYKFNKSIGMPSEIVRNVKYLLGSPEAINPYPIGEYSINIFNESTDFFDSYKLNTTQKKHLATIQLPENNFSPIGDYRAYPKELINTEYSYFLNKEVVDNFYLSPYELISREVDSMYIYVRGNITIDSLKDYVLTNLYVLMTRATISLNMYFENEETNKYFQDKLSKIKKYEGLDLVNFEDLDIEEGKQFYIRDNIIDDFLTKYEIENPKEEIEKRFITRLVHFTEESNIDSILEHGILPRKELEDLKFNFHFNDSNRWDRETMSISLSVENPNIRLLNKFKINNPGKKYKLITINPWAFKITRSSNKINNRL